jgi:hypothetical protein
MLRLLLASMCSVALIAGCSSTESIEDARATFFSSVDGSDRDCSSWLQWCIDAGYPQQACEERNEYCVDGVWVGGDDDDSSDPCDAAARDAYDDCLDGGGNEEACREVAAEAYDDCREG